MTIAPGSFRPIFHLPRLIYISLAAILVAAILGKIGVRYAFNANEGWNAFWAAAAWSGSDLYPPPDSLKLNNYVPLWFYVTGAMGRLTGDNILAGRILAGAALLLNGVVISLIVREITGRGRDCWFAGAAFLALSGVFYGDYVAINDPQLAANLVMTLAILLFVRTIDGPSAATPGCLVVALLLVGGLLKHNVVAAPIGMAVFLLLHRRPAFRPFAIRCAVGLAAVCAALYVLYGSAIFASLLFPRRYDLAVAATQTLRQLARYNVLLLVVVYLARRSDAKARFVFIYAIVALLQGLAFSGGFDVDVNVFFDFAVAVSVGLGLVQDCVFQALRREPGRHGPVLAAWLAITLVPPIVSAGEGFEEARRVVEAVSDNAQRADLAYVTSAEGRVLCQDLAFCYWAGKGFEVDINNLKTLVRARPELERDFIARIETCTYALIQLNDEWDSDEYDAPFTEKIIAALERHSTQANETDAAYYRVPSDCGK